MRGNGHLQQPWRKVSTATKDSWRKGSMSKLGPCSKSSLNGSYRLCHDEDSNATAGTIVYKHCSLAWGKQHWLYYQPTAEAGEARWYIGDNTTKSRKVKSSVIGRGGPAVGCVGSSLCSTALCLLTFIEDFCFGMNVLFYFGLNNRPCGLHWAVFTKKYGWCVDESLQVEAVPSQSHQTANMRKRCLLFGGPEDDTTVHDDSHPTHTKRTKIAAKSHTSGQAKLHY